MTKAGEVPPRTRKLTREDKKLANKIRELREHRDMSQIELSLRVTSNKNDNYIAFIETYRRGLSLPAVYRIAKVLGVEVKELFSW